MLAECSGVGIELDVAAIVPPPGVPITRWLKTFPSFGFLLATEQGKANALLSIFHERDLDAAVIGNVNAGRRWRWSWARTAPSFVTGGANGSWALLPWTSARHDASSSHRAC